jgi:tetratricopeptide (TPR) repeat protein
MLMRAANWKRRSIYWVNREVNLLRPVALLLISAAIPGFPQAPKPDNQPDNQLDSNEALFTVLAAINAAGYDAEIDSPSNSPERKRVREYLAAQKLDCLSELKRFVKEHKQKDPAADLSQYISFALAINGPPLFEPHYINNLMPPDAVQLDGLTPILVAFYREAHIEDLWKRVQPAFDEVIEQYQPPVSRAVLLANAYARNPTSGYLGHRFQVYIDLLGAPNQVQTRSYADDSFVVITPSKELRTFDIRHAYLHYLIDPIGLKFSRQLMVKAPLGDYALGSPLLAEHFKNDFVLLATECFIKAIESRMDKKPDAPLQAAKEGYVLTPAFAEILTDVYEKQDVVLRLCFPDLIEHLDFRREEKRLENFQFASEAPGRTVHVTSEKLPAFTGAELTLDKAESSYEKRDLKSAKDLYLSVLTETTVKPLHAKAYYGLARIAILQKDPELGDRLFRKVLELEPDAYTKSWSLLYLARLADSQGDREQAEEHYKAALAVEGAPDSVRKAAEKGLKEAFDKK